MIGLLIVVIVLFDRELGENMADDELRAMIDEFDHDGDGESMSLIYLFICCHNFKLIPPSHSYCLSLV